MGVLDAENRGALRPSQLAAWTVDSNGKLSWTAIFNADTTCFSRLDVDGDGELTWSEFLAAALPPEMRDREDLVDAAFRRFDMHKSGAITADTLRSLVGSHRDGVAIETLIKEATCCPKPLGDTMPFLGCRGEACRDDFVSLREASKPKSLYEFSDSPTTDLLNILSPRCKDVKVVSEYNDVRTIALLAAKPFSF